VYGFWNSTDALRFSIALIGESVEGDQVEVAEKGNPIVVDAHNRSLIVYPVSGDVRSKLVNKK
jgi:hypothetical protein